MIYKIIRIWYNYCKGKVRECIMKMCNGYETSDNMFVIKWKQFSVKPVGRNGQKAKYNITDVFKLLNLIVCNDFMSFYN